MNPIPLNRITLVDELIDDGRKLIDRLVEEKIPVIMACWVKQVENDRWSLCIATPLLDEKRAARAYREVYRVLGSLGNLWVTDSDIKLVGKDDPIARDALDIKRRFSVNLPTRFRRPRLGNPAVEETYFYLTTEPEEKLLRQSFMVNYLRKGDTNEWRAKTTREEVIRSARTKGAVGYSTAHWEGEKSDNVNHATVLVLVEIDPKFEKSNIEHDSELLCSLTKQANLTADQMFRQHHPDAVILRDESGPG
ncbi:MAG: hypothetical protein ACLQVF_46030 [Isosphaeraceae bacterium]